MCGIAGIVRFDDAPVDIHRLRAAQDVLACRGPDDRSDFVAGPCGLTHTRLAVLDPACGRQPMSAGELTAIFNGEIYNHRELRRRLESLGHRFTSHHSDTEVLLHGYRQWGVDLPRHLLGMFALAIWNAAENTLFLARDRAGKKPLYVHFGAREMLLASTVAALLAARGQAPPVDRAALGHYLTFGYLDEQSILQGVTEISAAHSMLVGADANVQTQRYWQPPPIAPKRATVDVTDTLRQTISDAVRARLEADVPLGCFLSGGVDSSLVAVLAQQHLQATGGRLKTFTLAMPHARYDEAPAAALVARSIGSEHHELAAEGDVESDLLTLTRSMGEPLGDSSLLPTYWISRAARRHVTVALSGDGGDELFAGYDRYRAMAMLRRYRWLLSCIPAALLGESEQKSHKSRVKRLILAAAQAQPARQYLSIVRLFTPRQMREMGVGDLALDDPPRWPRAADPLEAARRWDTQRYLPFDLLRKVDRASMQVGLEVRCPLLDAAVVELASELPISVLMARGRAKALLRQVAAPRVPAGILTRKKMGFALPLGPWFAGHLRPVLQRWLLEEPGLAELGLRRAALESLISQHAAGRADHTQRLFTLLSLAMWRRVFPAKKA